MAFDAGMLACALAEIREKALGARIEKVFQPERDEIVLQMRSLEGGKRLLINAGSNNPRICFTVEQKENPMTPPMLCMLLRKHLQGAKLSDVRQAGFERVAYLEFETRDEMGFPCKKYLVAEIMGKYSNLIFTSEEMKVITALRPVDFTTSALRQVLPGMTYELPPKQDKRDPMEMDAIGFSKMLSEAGEKACDKWLVASFLGLSPAVAREIVFRATGKTDLPVCACDAKRLSDAFFSMMEAIKQSDFSPCMILKDGAPVEYAFCQLLQYGSSFTMEQFESAGACLDAFFHTRDREIRIKQRASDVLRILTGADNRIRKKLELQRAELKDCEKGEEYKKWGDLITANLYQLSRGMTSAELIDYEDYHDEDGSFGKVLVTMDGRLPPAANAQVYYKKYNKSKTARVELSKQIALGEEELKYIDTVFDALTHAETAMDLTEIRDELYRSGYASRMKNYALSKKLPTPTVAQFETTGGYRVLCGKNNLQNEYITHKLAAKTDYWFHVKNLPGSHTVMLCHGEEPSERDFTEAAEIAAYFSKGAGGQNVEVDYTLVRNVKKPAGGRPGLVIYLTNWSCIVTPDEKRVMAMRVTGKRPLCSHDLM